MFPSIMIGFGHYIKKRVDMLVAYKEWGVRKYFAVFDDKITVKIY